MKKELKMNGAPQLLLNVVCGVRPTTVGLGLLGRGPVSIALLWDAEKIPNMY
jgi:hypothetical protein